MKNWQKLTWLVLVGIFIANQYLQRIAGIHIPFLYSYLDDLLAVPITLATYQFLMHYIRKEKNNPVSLAMVVVCIAGFTFHFEVLMPLLSARYTSDIWDIMMYLTGGIFYQLVWSYGNRKKPGIKVLSV